MITDAEESELIERVEKMIAITKEMTAIREREAQIALGYHDEIIRRAEARPVEVDPI